MLEAMVPRDYMIHVIVVHLFPLTTSQEHAYDPLPGSLLNYSNFFLDPMPTDRDYTAYEDLRRDFGNRRQKHLKEVEFHALDTQVKILDPLWRSQAVAQATSQHRNANNYSVSPTRRGDAPAGSGFLSPSKRLRSNSEPSVRELECGKTNEVCASDIAVPGGFRRVAKFRPGDSESAEEKLKTALEKGPF